MQDVVAFPSLPPEKSPRRSRAGSLGHRRSTSTSSRSGSLLSRIPFLRPSGDDRTSTEELRLPHKSAEEASDENGQDAGASVQATGRQKEEKPALAAIRQHKSRKRKGSLRKTALLGTGRLNLARRTSVDQRDWSEGPAKSWNGGQQAQDARSTRLIAREHASSTSAAQSSSISLPSPPRPSDSLRLEPPAPATTSGASSTTTSDGDRQLPPQDLLLLPTASPTSHYTSTTDDDEGLHLHHPSAHSLPLRRRSTLRNTSISASPVGLSAPPQLHTNSSASNWGWLILLLTWLTFVIGMGSCLGVWSWAWDVGETPYAPPELEDDATLPIVGYYPALFVCTGVMAWVWCLVSWVGMKYFKHARFDQGGGVGDG